MTRSLLLFVTLTLGAGACTATSHATRATTLGTVASAASMEALIDQPGPVQVETVNGADWAVTRAGLIDLDNPTAKAAGLKDGDEPIQVYAHVIHHPTRGVFLIDTGVSRKFVDDPAGLGIGWVLRKFLHPEKIQVRTDTATLLRREPPLAGVLFTHLHLDHISGMPDVPRGTPLYAGPGEGHDREFQFAFSRGSIDSVLAGHDAVQELPFAPDPSGRFAGVLDLFGDGTVFAIRVPGHTSGSIAYVVRTPSGPVLFTGDACHTRWGWEHDVPPGTFSHDRERSAVSLASLRGLAVRHPAMQVRLGHQR
jgi:glyoxylase-like metal-dependent hydrolase (beta-lactamase superfamily II)